MVKHALLALTAAGVISTSSVLAHAKLKGTSPAADAQLSAAPKSLTLTFNEGVQLAILKLTSRGQEIPLVFARSAAPAAQVTVALPLLPAGRYQVQWSVLSTNDGHAVHGAFSFVIAG
jgi:methionine-rich copper-binding protein CopC